MDFARRRASARSLTMPGDLVQTFPDAFARRTAASDAIALFAPGRAPATYRELGDAVDRLAAALRAIGLDRQDGIALLLPEGPELCVALLAAISVGVAIPLALSSPEADHHRVLVNGRARAVVISAAGPPSAVPLSGADLPVITLTVSQSGRVGDIGIAGPRLSAPGPHHPPAADDVALVLRSSGTTGPPKLVPITQRSIVSTCRTIMEMRGINPADRYLCPARMVYSQGFVSLTTSLFAGASLLSIPELDLNAMPRWLEELRPTYLSTTPAVLRALVADRSGLRDQLRQLRLRCIHCTASGVAAAEIEELEEQIGAPIRNGYGMTEATAVAGERFEGFRRVPGAVGPLWSEVRIVDEAGNQLQPGQDGEIVVRGPRVFSGYLDDPAANAVAFFPGGWFRTGDLGFLDEAGFLHLTGRLGEVINRGGEKIVPREVDDVLISHPAVAEAAVFPVPDGLLGQDIVAAVILTPGMSATARELRSWMLDRLSTYKVPRRIWMVDTLPRTPTGKVQRGVLAQRWCEAHR